MIAARNVIYTNVREVNRSNVVDILNDTKSYHEANIAQMRFLKEFEEGEQPIIRSNPKKYRPEINNCVIDNIAHEINTFHVGYEWSNPITFVQRGVRDSGTEDEAIAIALLNEQYENEGIATNSPKLGKSVVMFDRGYTYVEPNMDYQDGDSFFKHIVLNPFTTYVVYSSYYIDGREMMAVTYREDEKHVNHYTCITKDTRYEISEGKILYEDMNPIGMINVTEWHCNYDNKGMWEHQIDEMNNLNLMISDFTNNCEALTQTIWHSNDIEFPTEEIELEDGTKQEVTKKPKNGDWVQTFTPQNGKSPLIEPLTIDYDSANMLANIDTIRSRILEKSYVPVRNANASNTTGIAQSFISGYSDLDIVVDGIKSIQESCKMHEVKIALACIKISPFVPSDSPLLKLKAKDIQPNVKIQRLSEMTTKINGMVALIKAGFNGEHVIKEANYFSDPAQVWIDSKPMIEKLQESLVSGSQNNQSSEQSAIDEVKSDRNMQDQSDQINNSPAVDGTNISQTEGN